MLTVSYCEVGVDCDYVAKGETEEEIMKNAGEHAVKDHGYKQEDIMTPEMKEKNKFYNIFACPDFNKN
jgi:predicted small metal-binding protein